MVEVDIECCQEFPRCALAVTEDVDELLLLQQSAFHEHLPPVVGDHDSEPGRDLLCDVCSAFGTYETGLYVHAVDGKRDVIYSLDVITPDFFKGVAVEIG
jgi:hypothetical protein